jgi:hypothetical protein
VQRSRWQFLLAFFALIAVIYAIKGYRAFGEPKSGDALVLAQLREAGSDLSKPHPIEFFIYLPTRESALNIADKIRAKGFGARVDRAAQGPNWLCLGTKSMVPDLAAIEAIGAGFDEMARSLGGEYDGWETAVVK